MNANMNRMLRAITAIFCLVMLNTVYAQQPHLIFKPTGNGNYQTTSAEYEALMRQARLQQQQMQVQQQMQRQQQMQQFGNQLGNALGTALGNMMNNSAPQNNQSSPDYSRYNTPADSPQYVTPPNAQDVEKQQREAEEMKRLREMLDAGLLEYNGNASSDSLDDWANAMLSGDTRKFAGAVGLNGQGNASGSGNGSEWDDFAKSSTPIDPASAIDRFRRQLSEDQRKAFDEAFAKQGASGGGPFKQPGPSMTPNKAIHNRSRNLPQNRKLS